MSTHNYTAETYNGNLQILNNSISRINQTILPSDPISQFSMGYSVEIASFNSVLSDLQEICAKTISVYEKAKSEVCGNDTDSAAKLEDPIHDFSSLMTTLNSMASVMISGGNTSTFGKELEESLSDCTYEGMAEVKLSDYVTYDSETGEYTITDENYENLKKYFKDLADKDGLSDEDYIMLSKIVNSFINSDGSLNTEAMEKFVSATYTSYAIGDYTKDNTYQHFVDNIKSKFVSFFGSKGFSQIESVSIISGETCFVGFSGNMVEFINRYKNNDKSGIIADILKDLNSQSVGENVTIYSVKMKNGETKILLEYSEKIYDVTDGFDYESIFGNVKIDVVQDTSVIHEPTGEEATFTKVTFSDNDEVGTYYYKGITNGSGVMDKMDTLNDGSMKKYVECKVNELIEEEYPNLKDKLGEEALKKIVDKILDKIPGYSEGKDAIDFVNVVTDYEEEINEIKEKVLEASSINVMIARYLESKNKIEIYINYCKYFCESCDIKYSVGSDGFFSYSCSNFVLDYNRINGHIKEYNNKVLSDKDKVSISDIENFDFQINEDGTIHNEKVRGFIDYFRLFENKDWLKN